MSDDAVKRAAVRSGQRDALGAGVGAGNDLTGDRNFITALFYGSDSDFNGTIVFRNRCSPTAAAARVVGR